MQHFRRLFERATPAHVDMPSRVIESGAPRIHDGLDYALPVLLPQHQREQLEKAGRLNAWLTEQVRSSFALPFDDPGYRAGENLGTLVIEDPLREWNWTTRTRVLSSTHSAYSRNPVAKRAVHYVSAFVVGEGFNLNCKNKDVERVLTEFIDNPDNAIREYERQAVRDLLIDGELFLRFFEQAGEVVSVPMRPWEIQYIRTEQGFFRRPLSYHVQPYSEYNADDPESEHGFAPYDVPSEEVLHIAINRHAYELRGRPELYSALPWLRAHKEWLENRARQNYWRGALVWWVKIASAVPGVIAAKLAQYQRPPTPGSTVVTSDKEEWSVLSNSVGAGEASEDGRQLKIMALNAIAGIPEYMTGDGENANLASTQSQQLPVLTTFSEFQTIMIEQVWFPIFKRVIQVAIDAGLLAEEVEEQDADGDPVLEDPPDVADVPPLTMPQPGLAMAQPAKKMPPKKLKAIDAFDVQYAPMGGDDTSTLAAALDVAAANGWVSDQTATTEMGFDYAIEQKRIKRELKQKNEAMLRGEVPMPPEMMPQGMADDNGAQDEQPPKQEAA